MGAKGKKKASIGRQKTLAERLFVYCGEECYRSWLFNDAVSIETMVMINEYGAVGGMRAGTEIEMIG